MRLTLRTLLAYLDDTLQANEIKEIGLKVAESDAAQELIARIKAVTRRRRLTAPAVAGPNSMDPNSVAEYLDNELPSEDLGDLEKVALESDVHLAEIAACHQILTLVLGEPALVPPTARERMYGLVHGREAIPFRKAAPAKPAADTVEDEDGLSLGGAWLKWVLPAAALLLVGALGLAVYQVLEPRSHRVTKLTPSNGGSPDEQKAADDKAKEKEKEKEKERTNGSGKEGKGKKPENSGTTPPIEPPGPAEVKRPNPPSPERVDAGNYQGGGSSDLPSLLVRKKTGEEGWQQVPRSAMVYTNEPLTALPGSTALIKGLRNKDFNLLLRGHVREFSMHPVQDFLMESAVVLHKNDELDLDLTLQRGRIYFRNLRTKGPLKVRVRFEGEVWDMNLLEQGTEVGMDLVKRYTPEINWRTGEEPRTELALCLLSGEMELKVDPFRTDTMEAEVPKVAVIFWDSFTKAGEPQRISEPQKVDIIRRLWAKTPPPTDQLPAVQRNAVKQMSAALKNLEVLMTNKKATADIALLETLSKEEIASRLLAVYCLGAIDETNKLIDVLGDENPDHAFDRTVAVHTLRRWLSRGPGQSKLLYDKDSKTGALTGVLIDKKYKPREAETIRDLLFDFPLDESFKPETFTYCASCLQRKVAIAELAYYHLRELSRGAKLPQGFNAADPLDLREAYAKRIEDLIAKRLLPPSLPSAPSAPSTPREEKK